MHVCFLRDYHGDWHADSRIKNINKLCYAGKEFFGVNLENAVFSVINAIRVDVMAGLVSVTMVGVAECLIELVAVSLVIVFRVDANVFRIDVEVPMNLGFA